MSDKCVDCSCCESGVCSGECDDCTCKDTRQLVTQEKYNELVLDDYYNCLGWYEVEVMSPGSFEGQHSLSELAELLRAKADQLESLMSEGYEMSGDSYDGYAFAITIDGVIQARTDAEENVSSLYVVE